MTSQTIRDNIAKLRAELPETVAAIEAKGRAEDWARGAKLIREAHRYCSGHEFEDCPMWRAYVDRFSVS